MHTPTKHMIVARMFGMSLPLGHGFGAVFLAIVLAFSLTQPASAATFTVTKIADTNDGMCNADCSLREAIGAANALGGADMVVLPAGTYTLSIAGTGEDANATGDLDITGELDINGAGNASTLIDGGGIDRVLEVRPGAMVRVSSVTIRNGSPGTNAGGILNRATLTLIHSIVTGNTGLDFGGGIFSFGTMTLLNTTVSDNDTVGFNLSGGGGGIFNQGTMTLSGTTVSGNTTLGRGGGIYNLDLALTLANSTISGNTARNGGAIFNRFGTVQIVSSTITDNTATDNGGGVWNFGGTMTLKNTIVSANMAATPADDCAGSLTSLGHNLASDATCSFGGTGDLNSTDPLLGPLADNGGPTMTHALLDGSPALDAVPLAFCTVSTDQRGVSRPQGDACDIGAYERLKDGMGNQTANADAAATADTTVTIHGEASNAFKVRQDAKGEGGINQSASVGASATLGLGVTQGNEAKNGVSVLQGCRAAFCNQDAAADPSATSDASLTGSLDAENDLVIDQDPEGNRNQHAETTADAVTEVEVEQDSGAENVVEIEQNEGTSALSVLRHLLQRR